MYDAYYFGLEEYLMDVVQRIEIKTLMDKKYCDDHAAVMGRCGALADFMSSGCLFLSKLAGAISLLAVVVSSCVGDISKSFYWPRCVYYGIHLVGTTSNRKR